MRRRGMALLLALSLLLGGCWDHLEPEDTSYAISLGIDATDARGEYLWTFRIADSSHVPIGTLTTTTSPESRRGVITVRGRSLVQAVQMVQASLTRVLSLVQLRTVVFGEGLARQGLEPVLNDLRRHNEVRLEVQATVSSGRAVELMLQDKPLDEVNPIRSLEGWLLVQKRMHLGPPTRLMHFLGRLMAHGIDPFLPLAAINPLASQSPTTPLPPLQNKSLQAGEFPREGGNPVEIAGTAIFKQDRLVGFLNVDETSMLLSMRGEMGKIYASEPDPLVPGEVVSFRFHQENKPRYRVQFTGGRALVQVELQFEGEVLSAPSGVSYANPENRAKLEGLSADYDQRIVALLQRIYGEWEADPIGIGQLVRSRFPTYDAWMAYDWGNHIKETQFQVKSRLFVRRFGMMLDEFPKAK